MHEKPHVQGTLEGDQDFGGAWEVLGSSTVQAAHYLGFILIPLGAFLVGVFQYDLLHAGYLAQLLVYFLGSTARLEPPLETAVVPLRQVIICRFTFFGCQDRIVCSALVCTPCLYRQAHVARGAGLKIPLSTALLTPFLIRVE